MGAALIAALSGCPGPPPAPLRMAQSPCEASTMGGPNPPRDAGADRQSGLEDCAKPADLLAPFWPNNAPYPRAHPVEGVIEQAFAAAASFDYVTASRHAAAIEALLRRETTDRMATERGVLALDLLDRAGIRRSARGPSPYVTGVLSPLFNNYQSNDKEVCRRAWIQPIEGARDLRFIAANARSLDPLESGKPSLAAFLREYDKAVTLADEGKLAWAFMPELLHERGDAPGRDPRLTRTYMRVTALALGHIKAARALAEGAPPDHRAISVLGLAAEPGALGDEAVARALIDLAEVTASSPIHRAEDEGALLDALLTGALHGASLPRLVAGPYMRALEAALAARLRGDWALRTGYTMALLHASAALLRTIMGVDAGVERASENIVKALTGAGPHPELAALASAAARLVALVKTGELTPRSAVAAAPKPALRDARDALSKAILGLGEPKLPAAIAGDLTALTVGVLALMLSPPNVAPPPKASSNVACEPPPPEPDVYARRALDQLGDVRRRLAASPAMKAGEGESFDAARLLYGVLSDVLDHLSVSAGPTLPWADAKGWIERGLARWSPKAPAMTAIYGVVRGLALRGKKEGLLTEHPKDVGAAAALLVPWVGADPQLVEALVTMSRLGTKGDGERVRALANATRGGLVHVAFLAAVAVANATRSPPEDALVRFAEEAQSLLAWPLVVASARHRSAGAPEPSALERVPALNKHDTCENARMSAFIEASKGLYLASSGKLSEGRALLDRALAAAERDGFTVPKRVYRYVSEAGPWALSIEAGASFGGLLLSGADSYGVGIGPKGGGVSLGVSDEWARFDSPTERDEAARAYVHLAALASALHFSAGDDARGVYSAGLAVSALSGALRLGPRVLVANQPEAWGSDARGAMILAAEMAAERGHAFLAGDLWAAIQRGGGTEAELLSSIEPLPPLLAPFSDLAAVAKRAKLPLRVIAYKPPCDEGKKKKGRKKAKKKAPPFGMFEEPACALYPHAIALRIADKLPWLPRLHRAFGAAAGCPLSRRSLDTFLGGVNKGGYDPDAFIKAVSDARSAGLSYDAAALLARHARQGHCAAPIVTAARELGASSDLPAPLRADLLTLVVNCQSASKGSQIEADVRALDAVMRRLPDPTRDLTLSLSAGDLALKQSHWGILEALTRAPGYVNRWLGLHPDATLTALVLHHASAVMANRPIDLAATEEAYVSACELLPTSKRKARCAELAALRGGKGDNKGELAKKMLEAHLAEAAVKGN